MSPSDKPVAKPRVEIALHTFHEEEFPIKMEFIRGGEVIHTIVSNLGDEVIRVPAFGEPKVKVRCTFGNGAVTESD